MKSFTSAVIIAASAAFASAQITTDPSTGVITCAIPNGAYCAGDSLGTNIIIRCTNGTGHPGNCNDNLSGNFPYGVNYAPCYQSSPTSGDAACSKNCIVEGGSGNFPGTLSLPGCTQVPQSTSTSASSASASSPASTSTSTSANHTVTSHTTKHSSTTVTRTATTSEITSIPASTFSTAIGPIATGTGVVPPPNSNNGTFPTGGGNGGSSGSATATPVGPTSTTSGGGSPEFTGAAMANSAGTALAAVGLVVAYFL